MLSTKCTVWLAGQSVFAQGDGMRSLFTSLVFLFIGLGVASLAVKNELDNMSLGQHGVTTAGTTSGARTSFRHGSLFSHTLDYTFNVNGVEYKGSSSVSEDLFNRFSSGIFYVPRRINVLYLPENPSINRIDEIGVSRDHYLWAGLFFLALFGSIGAWGLVQSLRDLRFTKWPKRVTGFTAAPFKNINPVNDKSSYISLWLERKRLEEMTRIQELKTSLEKSSDRPSPEPKKSKGDVFYIALVKAHDKASEPSDYLITATVSEEVDADGKMRIATNLYEHHDMFTVVEAASAAYWHNKIQKSEVTPEQLVSWLITLEKKTGNRYYIPSASSDINNLRQALYVGLVHASLHYSMCHPDSKPMQIYRANQDCKIGRHRIAEFKQSEQLAPYLQEIDSNLAKHLAASVNPGSF